MGRYDQIRKLLSKAAGIAVLLAGGLLAASLCFGAPGDPSPVPSIFGKSTLVYFAGALMIGAIFSYHCARLALRKSNASARQLLTASILYLPAISALIILDRKWP
jgi:hypothetical protein